MTFTDEAAAKLGRLIRETADGRESGGPLLGTINADRIAVGDVGGPELFVAPRPSGPLTLVSNPRLTSRNEEVGLLLIATGAVAVTAALAHSEIPAATLPKDPCPYGVYESHMRLRNDSRAPEWSADGRWIAVVRNGQPAIVESGGSGRVFFPNVSVPRGRTDLRFSWAPRGTALIVRRQTDLFLVRPGRPAKRVARGCFGAWHPNGKMIAWTADGRVYMSRPDGSRRRVVTEGGYVDDWSPDGRSLLVARTTPLPSRCERTRLVVVRLATGRATALTGETVERNGQAFTRSNQGVGSFSPDGRSIAFPEEVPCGYTGGDRLRFAYVWNVRTGSLRLIDRGLPAWAPRRNVLAVAKGMEFSVTDPANRQFQFRRGGGFVFGDARPSLSPGGRMVVYSAVRNAYGVTSVEVARIDRPSQPRTFADRAWGPSWSPDGRRIAYLGYDECRDALFVSPVSGRSRRLLLPCL